MEMGYVIKGQVIKKERSGVLAKKLMRCVIRHHESCTFREYHKVDNDSDIRSGDKLTTCSEENYSRFR
jgi:hypothetical protein